MSELQSLLTPSNHQLSKKRQRVAELVLQNPRFASFASASQIAQRAGVDPATVTRLAQSLGFASFPTFQAEIRHTYLSTLGPLDMMRERQGQLHGRSLIQATLLQDITNLTTMLDQVNEQGFGDLADRIVGGAQVLTVATGASGGVATSAAYLLQFLGLPARAEVRGGLYLAAELALLRPRDIVLGISFWRGARETIQALTWARRHDVYTVALTDSNLSPLAKEANHVLIAPSEGTSFFQSMTAALSLVYCLVALVADRMQDDRLTHQERIDEVIHHLGTMYGRSGQPRDGLPTQGKRDVNVPE